MRLIFRYSKEQASNVSLQGNVKEKEKELRKVSVPIMQEFIFRLNVNFSCKNNLIYLHFTTKD
jgi:hypothetical protein